MLGLIFDINIYIYYSMFLCGHISMRGLIYRWMVYFGWDLHVNYFLGSLETSGDGDRLFKVVTTGAAVGKLEARNMRRGFFMGMKSTGHNKTALEW